MTRRTARFKVTIHCNMCGERFILRGNHGKNGKIETGFKQCICSNQEDFRTETEPLS